MIRFWQPGDQADVSALLLACLEETAREGADVEPTAANVEQFWTAGLAGAGKGEPALVADDGGVVGFVLWLPVNGAFTIRGRTLFGFGTYVAPRARRTGVSVMLRTEAIRIAREKGYTRVIGVAHGEAGIASGLAAGFKFYGLQGELPLC